MGSLVIVGTGICSVAQTTIEARAHMQQSDKLLFLVADPISQQWIRSLNPTAESLEDCYRDGEHRRSAYQRMVERIMGWVRRDGCRVCVALYGHPGVFVLPSHDAIRQAREEGFEARMLPGISAEDCLFADVGFDPAAFGCQTFEATEFLLSSPRTDPRAHLVLWQVGVIADPTFSKTGKYKAGGVAVLAEKLRELYPSEHEVIVYCAAQLVVSQPLIRRVSLAVLTDVDVPPISTLYVPPLPPGTADSAMAERLGITSTRE